MNPIISPKFRLMKKKVCCIVVNWNTFNDTIACIESVLSMQLCPDTLVIFDNGSTDGSKEKIENWSETYFTKNRERLILTAADISSDRRQKPHPLQPRFVLIHSSENLGFARGNNLCISWALQQKTFSHFWLLNPDTTVDAQALKTLLDCAENDSAVGVWGSSICLSHDPKILQCAGGCRYNPLTTIIKPAYRNRSLRELFVLNPLPALDYIIGASMFIAAGVIDSIGLLCNDFFLFYEELDFCRRAQNKGYSIAWCKHSIVYHKGGTSSDNPKINENKYLSAINYHETISTLIFTKKHYPLLLPIVLPFRFFGKLFHLIRRRQLFLVSPLVYAYINFFRGKPPASLR